MSNSVRDLVALAILVIALVLITMSLIRVWPRVHGARDAVAPPAVTGGKPLYTRGDYYCIVPLEQDDASP